MPMHTPAGHRQAKCVLYMPMHMPAGCRQVQGTQLWLEAGLDADPMHAICDAHACFLAESAAHVHI